MGVLLFRGEAPVVCLARISQTPIGRDLANLFLKGQGFLHLAGDLREIAASLFITRNTRARRLSCQIRANFLKKHTGNDRARSDPALDLR